MEMKGAHVQRSVYMVNEIYDVYSVQWNGREVVQSNTHVHVLC